MFGLTLDETLAQQEDLERLCQERRQDHPEIFRGNAFYGIDQILKTYADLPLDYALKGVVPHGISLSEKFVWLEEIFNPLPAVFYYAEYAQKKYEINLKKHHLRKKLFPLGSPFLYLVDLYKSAPKPQRKGTLFFLSHSTHRITAESDINEIIAQLKALDEVYHPITICLYWRDYQLGRQQPFEAQGFRVMSAGHMYDPLFFPRLYHLLSMHRYACGNEIGSHLFYAVKAGCPYFLLKAGEVTYTADDPRFFSWSFSDFNVERIQQVEALFQSPSQSITPTQLDIVDYYMGAQYVQSPQDLRQQFIQLEQWYELAQDTQRYFQVDSPPVAEQLNAVPSEVSAKERHFLYHFFAKFWSGNEDVLEIGPFLGGTTRAIALGMATHPHRNPQTKLYTCDRFQGYYDSQRLLDYLQSAFEQQQLPEVLKATIEQSDQFLEVFQAFHQNQPYAEFLIPQSQTLPDSLEEVEQLEQRFEPPDSTFGAVFVDGCKSWYGTKYFLLKMAAHVHKGTFFLFQDYGWYTCFWIPLILMLLEDYFEPITHVGSTYGFQLSQDLSAEAIATRLPDTLSVSDKGWIDQTFAQLFIQAQNTDDTRAMTTYTLQHGAALAYLGFADEAKVKMTPLLTQPWAKDLEPKILEALRFPTYWPSREPVPLFTEQDHRQLLITQQAYTPFYQELEQVKQQNVRLTQRLNESSQRVQQLTCNLETVREKLAGKQEKIVTLQEKLAKKVQQVDKIERRQRHLVQQLQADQTALSETQAQVTAMESSKFWKLRTLWLRARRKLRL